MTTMSLWGVHAGFAATVTIVLVAGRDLTARTRGAVLFVSAVWAVVPDLYHPVPGAETWYKPVVHDSILANAFWFHRVFDRLDPDDRAVYSLAMTAIFLAVFAITELRIRRRADRQ